MRNRTSVGLWLLLSLLLVIPARGAAPPALHKALGASAAPSGACPSAEELAASKVDGVALLPRHAASGASAAGAAAGAPIVELRDALAVHVSGLGTVLAREKCSATRHKLVLFLDGRPVPKATPLPPADPANEVLNFVLDRTEDSRATWTHLLGRPSFGLRDVTLSVGVQDEYPIASDQRVRLRAIPRGWFAAWSVLLALLVAALAALAVKSDVLRETGAPPGGGARKPYSLAKMQAAWWFFLVLASYLFIGLVCGDYRTTITGTVLAILGISAATAVGSATIDAGKAFATSGAPAAPQVAGQPVPSGTRGHWWLDILSDEHGVNFHRFQMAAWTAVLGVIFVHEVYAGLAMPEFDATLLGLLGISAGTYLGLKTTSEQAR
jgi:hypothetical protein